MHQPQVEDPFPNSQRMIPAQVDRVTGQVWVPLEQAVKLNNIYTPPATPASASLQPRPPTRLSQAASSTAAETIVMMDDEKDSKDTKGNIQLFPQQNPNEPKIVGDIIYIDVDPIPNDEPSVKDEGAQCLLCLELGNKRLLPFYTSENARNEHVRVHVEQCDQGFAAVLGRCFPDRSAPAPAAVQPQKKKASESKTKKKLTPSTSQAALPAKKKKKEEKVKDQKKVKLSVPRSQPTQEKQKSSSAGKQRTNERIEQEWTRVLGTLKSAKSISCRKPGCEASFKEAGQLTRFHLTGHVHYHLDTASTARVTRSSAKHSVEDEKLLLEIQTCFPAV